MRDVQQEQMKRNRANIYLFNPTCEYAVANGNATWHPNRLLQKMESDLSLLPMYLAQQHDYVLTPDPPSDKFKESLQQFNIDLPKFTSFDSASFKSDLIDIPKNRLLPWGWSPAAHKKLDPLKNNCSVDFQNSPVYNWKSEYREVYSKKFAKNILKTILTKYPHQNFIPESEFTQIATTQKQIEDLLKRWGKLMIKAPWSSSGRGLQTIRRTPIHPKVWEKIMGMIKDQGYCIVEPYRDKELDLAFQFLLEKGKIRFLGFSNFSTDYKGQYNGNNLNGLPNGLKSDMIEFADHIPQHIIPSLIEVLEKSDLAKNYEGIFGVDTLIFRDKKGMPVVNPCMEINVRQNMGLLSLRFENLLIPETKGLFRTYYDPKLSFYDFSTTMSQKHPLKVLNNKIESGFFPLTDGSQEKYFGAYLLV